MSVNRGKNRESARPGSVAASGKPLGPFVVPYTTAPIKSRDAITFAPMLRTVRIVGDNNGAGLTHDQTVLGERFAAAGWHVVHADRRVSAARDVVVTVHLESPVVHLLGTATYDIVIPNPEWWAPINNQYLRRPTVTVWAKTEDAARLFQPLASRVELLGFSSRDRRCEAPRRRAFLHVAGASPNKATDVLFRAWRPEWPQLTVLKWSSKPIRNSLANIRIIYDRIADAELVRLQNEHVFHIYPSRYEGFGHAQWEGLSCGAVVLVTDAPLWPAACRRMASEPAARSVGIADMRAVREGAVVDAVVRACSLSDEALEIERAASRAAWEANRDSFADHAAALIDRLAPRSTVELIESASLRDQPAFLFAGRVACLTGQGEAARHQIHALRRHGLRLRVLDTGSVGDPDRDRSDSFVQAARVSDTLDTPGGSIIHLQPNTAETVRGRCPRPHIIVSVWETSRLPVAWVARLNTYDQVWCATEWQAAVYRDSGVDARLIRVVPFALDPALFPLDGAQLDGVRLTGGVTFGSVFQWSERKNPGALLRAYLRAFSADDRVRLVLKTYEGDSAATKVDKHIEQARRPFAGKPGGPPPIHVVTRPLPRREILAFHRALDCYVSTHCGEGFGIPIAEALLLGRSVIATDWSAPSEYASGLFTGVDYTLQPPHGMNWQPFYTPDQRWARIDEGKLADTLRAFYEGRLVRGDGAVARAAFERTMTAVGEAARTALEALRK